MFFIVLTPLYLLFTIFMVAFSKLELYLGFNNKASCDSHTLPPCIADVEDYSQTAWRVLLILICLLAGFFIPPTLYALYSLLAFYSQCRLRISVWVRLHQSVLEDNEVPVLILPSLLQIASSTMNEDYRV